MNWAKRTFHGNDESTLALDHLSNHVVDKTMLVPEILGLEFFLVFLFVDFLENILESSVILFKDRVLGAHVQRHFLEKRHLETGMCESNNRLIRVVLGLCDTRPAEFEHLDALWFAAVLGSKDNFESSLAGDHLVLGAVLVAKGMSADDNGLFPAGYQTRDIGDDDGLPEDGTVARIH